jgi:uncharacterized protein YegP (UPF0339 family)
MGYYIYLDPQGYWRWYLLAPGHRRVANSAEGFHQKQDCREQIAMVKGSTATPVYEV